jgi:hypothetical protein
MWTVEDLCFMCRLVTNHAFERSQRYVGRTEKILVEAKNPRPGKEDQVMQILVAHGIFTIFKKTVFPKENLVISYV